MISARPVSGVVLLSLILHCYYCHGVAAWQSSSINRPRLLLLAKDTTTTTTTKSTELFSSHPNYNVGPTESNNSLFQTSRNRRRQFLQIMGTTAAAAATTVVLPHQAKATVVAAAAVTAESARDQWRRGSNAIDDLLKNWSTEEWAEKTSGGDIVRVQLGRMDTSSPLFQIEKAFKVLRDSDYLVGGDEIEFVETSEEFMEALYRADLFAQDSNLKTGSGKQTPPAVSLENSRKEVGNMQRIAKRLTSMVK